jgi:hypothetical protein
MSLLSNLIPRPGTLLLIFKYIASSGCTRSTSSFVALSKSVPLVQDTWDMSEFYSEFCTDTSMECFVIRDSKECKANSKVAVFLNKDEMFHRLFFCGASLLGFHIPCIHKQVASLLLLCSIPIKGQGFYA